MSRAMDPRQAATQACLRYRLDVCDAPIVEQMMGRPESCWQACCNGGCRPCMDDYADAARYGQELVRQAAASAPAPAE